jgi:hypothetical protein
METAWARSGRRRAAACLHATEPLQQWRSRLSGWRIRDAQRSRAVRDDDPSMPTAHMREAQVRPCIPSRKWTETIHRRSRPPIPRGLAFLITNYSHFYCVAFVFSEAMPNIGMRK